MFVNQKNYFTNKTLTYGAGLALPRPGAWTNSRIYVREPEKLFHKQNPDAWCRA
jgi:hypothetical protein